MLSNYIIKITVISIFLIPKLLFAECAKPIMPSDIEWNSWINDISIEAENYGIGEKTIKKELSNLKPIEKIILRDRCQPESTISFKEYVYYRLDKTRIYNGRNKSIEFQKQLTRVSKEFDIQKEIILAIWGLESYYGKNQGKTKIIPALATLTFDKKRSEFYKKQLLAALKIIDNKIVSSENLLGSWAGAMGQVQFLPTTFFDSALDFDNNGKIDIWNSELDVFASIANYLTSLEKAPWDSNLSWGIEVTPPKNISSIYDSLKQIDAKGCYAVRTMSIEKNINEWINLGFKNIIPMDKLNMNVQARLVSPDGMNGRMFLVFRNYKSILYYNCSHYYGLTVGLLSDKLKE